MNCKETEQLIPYFLEDELDNEELGQCLEHIESCDDCLEELTIHFLISIGLKRLEDGNEFNLKKEFADMIIEAKHRFVYRNRLLITADVLKMAVIIMCFITVSLVIII